MNFMGIDISQSSFTVAIHGRSDKPDSFENSNDGFERLRGWLKERQLQPAETVACLEDTGTYAESLCYWLAAHGVQVSVEPPHRVKRAFSDTVRKSDTVDARQIAEYAARFSDQLHKWSAPEPVLEQVKVLLSTREQMVEQMTAQSNTLHQLSWKVVKTPLAEQAIAQTIAHLKEQIKKIDKEIAKLISNHPTLGQTFAALLTIPGVGTLLAANVMVMAKGFAEPVDPRRLAAYLGICPLEYQSGTSVYRKPRSRKFGPSRVRKLLYLAAMSLRTHDRTFKHYFLRKVDQGKSKRLVLNNIANRLVRIICAVGRTKTPFIDGYKSVNPRLIHA